MSREAEAEALLIEVSRWQRAEANRLGIPLPLHRGELAQGQLSGAQCPSTKDLPK